MVKKVAQDRIIQNLEIAKKLDLKYTVFHTNSLPMMGKEDYYENWVKEHVAFWKEMISKYDVTILLENMWDKTPEYVARVFEEVDSPRLKLCFDTGHHHIFSEVSLEDWFKRLGKHIACFHLNDNHGDKDSELTLGEGTFPWKEWGDLVLKYCDSPIVVMEMKNLEMIDKSVNFLKEQKVYPFD
jgi:sugar phosphate isomerase/epimerase